MACDPFWNRTVLACHFDGSNGSTTFTDEKGNTLTANGGAQIDTGQSKFGGASLFVDGNAGSYVSSSIAGADITATDATVEAYVYVTAWDTYSYFVSRGDIGGRSWAVGVRQTALDFYWFNGGDAMVSASVSLSLNTWYHVAAVKYGTTVMLFLDGVLKGSGTVASMASGTGTLRIGSFMGYTGISHCLRGWIDDLRITKFARYVGEFTPDASAFVTNQCTISGTIKDASNNNAARLVRLFRRDTAVLVGQTVSDATTGGYSFLVGNPGEYFVVAHDSAGDPSLDLVVLACHFDGADGSTDFVDEKGIAITVYGDAKISTAQSKFGGSSAFFDGGGDYARATLPPLGSGDFTVEYWVYSTSLYNYITHVCTTRGGTGWSCGAQGAAQLVWYSSGREVVRGTTAMSANAWHHVAYVRKDGILKGYLDGVQDGTYGIETSNFTDTSLWIGCLSGGSEFMTGYLEDLRITKSARYLSDFTPPQSPFSTASFGGTENAVNRDRVIPE